MNAPVALMKIHVLNARIGMMFIWKMTGVFALKKTIIIVDLSAYLVMLSALLVKVLTWTIAYLATLEQNSCKSSAKRVDNVSANTTLK